jgi:hypothetical protein
MMFPKLLLPPKGIHGPSPIHPLHCILALLPENKIETTQSKYATHLMGSGAQLLLDEFLPVDPHR